MTLTDKGREALAKCRAIIGGEADPFSVEWREMSHGEREFWLKASRLSVRWAREDSWTSIPSEDRARVKSVLYRAARRAEALLGLSE